MSMDYIVQISKPMLEGAQTTILLFFIPSRSGLYSR